MNNTFYKENNLSGLKEQIFKKQSTVKKLICLFFQIKVALKLPSQTTGERS